MEICIGEMSANGPQEAVHVKTERKPDCRGSQLKFNKFLFRENEMQIKIFFY